MKKIKSFCIDHNRLQKGLYLSKINKDIITYDLRMVQPNQGNYLENDGLHTFEHLLATYLRNTDEMDAIIYVGPMGCRTGFYVLTRDCYTPNQCLHLLKEAMQFIIAFQGIVPGTSDPSECGNVKDHNLEKAKAYAKDYAQVLSNWNEEQMHYEKEL